MTLKARVSVPVKWPLIIVWERWRVNYTENLGAARRRWKRGIDRRKGGPHYATNQFSYKQPSGF